jgi:DNA-binding HxlR family transcriptional regulator
MDHEGEVCQHFQRAAELLARRWIPQIVLVLLSGPQRFSDLRAAIPSISDTLLSERLKELEADRILTRTVTPSTPVRIEYALTKQGHDLSGVLGELSGWAERWSGPVDADRSPATRVRPRRRSRHLS